MALMGKGKPSIGEPKMVSLYDAIGQLCYFSLPLYFLLHTIFCSHICYRIKCGCEEDDLLGMLYQCV